MHYESAFMYHISKSSDGFQVNQFSFFSGVNNHYIHNKSVIPFPYHLGIYIYDPLQIYEIPVNIHCIHHHKEVK